MNHRLQALCRIALLLLAALLLGGSDLVVIGGTARGAAALEAPLSAFQASEASLNRDSGAKSSSAREPLCPAGTGSSRSSVTSAMTSGRVISTAGTATAGPGRPAALVGYSPIPSISSTGYCDEAAFRITKPDNRKIGKAGITELGSSGGLSLPPALAPA